MKEIELKYGIIDFPDDLFIKEIQEINQNYLYSDLYSAIRKRKVRKIVEDR